MLIIISRASTQYRREVALVGKGHILEGHFAAHAIGRERKGIRLILDFNWQVKVLEDAVKQRQRALNLHLYIEQLSNREEQTALQCGKSHDATKCESGVVWLRNNKPTGDEVDNCRGY